MVGEARSGGRVDERLRDARRVDEAGGEAGEELAGAQRVEAEKGHAGTPCAIQHNAPRRRLLTPPTQWVHNGRTLVMLPPAPTRAWWSAAAARRRARSRCSAPPRPRRRRRAIDQAQFTAFLAELKTEAVDRGISAAVAARALDGLAPLPVVVERDRGQAETVLSIDDYVRRRLTPTTVRRAREMAARHKAILQKVGEAYGVQPRVLVAVWGLESNFGRFSGVRPMVQALATLAWEGRRGAFFTRRADRRPADRRSRRHRARR